jgi:hypothetical protein
MIVQETAALRKQLETVSADRQTLTASFQATLTTKEEEIKLLQSMLAQNTKQYQAALQVLRDKVLCRCTLSALSPPPHRPPSSFASPLTQRAFSVVRQQMVALQDSIPS